MRGLDPAPIQAALDADADAARLDAARFRRAERWRDRLVEGSDTAVAEFLAEFPGDAQELARLIAAARAERHGRSAAGAGRRLFRHVQATLAAAGN
jgi:ribosomal 50S subunit-associated protein YjgA (DUF615 family)